MHGNMNQPDPFQPPVADLAPPPLSQGEPAAIKVFGIMHLVFAPLGILSALWGLFVAMVGKPWLLLSDSPAKHDPQLQAQLAMQEKLNPMTIATSMLSLGVGVVMIIAGVQLLRKRKTALKWSNAYAWSSLGTKFVTLILTLTVMLPAMQEMTRAITHNSKVPQGVETFMSSAMAVGTIGGVLVSCLYPVLSLVLLNRPASKAWFAQR
jgi:hypothetical protein